MSANPKQIWTPESYLELERASETKHEFYRGEVFDMSGASFTHTVIAVNTTRELSSQLRKKPCTVHSNDLRIQVRAAGLFTYPDVIVICGEPRFLDKRNDTVTNPTLIIEVLSKSTESYDRGKKFQHYRTLETLQEYVLISQDSANIERFTRQPGGDWLLSAASGLDATVTLASVGCTLALADVYEKVDFEEQTET